jgi:hypothetical protein
MILSGESVSISLTSFSLQTATLKYQRTMEVCIMSHNHERMISDIESCRRVDQCTKRLIPRSDNRVSECGSRTVASRFLRFVRCCQAFLAQLNKFFCTRIYRIPWAYSVSASRRPYPQILSGASGGWLRDLHIQKCSILQATSAGVKDQEAVNFLEKKLKSNPQFSYDETVQVSTFLCPPFLLSTGAFGCQVFVAGSALELAAF